MIIQFDEIHVVEAIRHNDDLDMISHFKNDCGWTKKQLKAIEHFDFYTVEIKVTDQQGNENSEYLGACCSEDFDQDVKNGISGYLPQMISEAIEGLS
jgi:2,3-bisphosphoglycerate-independent phosphoglycerate mutase